MTVPAAPSLLLDAMLGKLARWLRLLGYDVVYMQAEDHVLARRARAEGRVLLTRDRELARRRGLEALLITSQELAAQLAQVRRELPAPSPDTPPRCMTCNAPLSEVSREEAAAHVPPYVARVHSSFRRCPVCEKIYWPGTHWRKIKARLSDLENPH